MPGVDRQARAAPGAGFRARGGRHPGDELRADRRIDQRRPAFAPVFPWKVVVPASPFRVAGARRLRLANQGEIADGNHARPAGELARVAVAVGEGVELLDIAQVESRLLLNRSEEHTSELQSLMRISYAVFCLKKKKKQK